MFILLADDDELFAAHLRTTLAAEGHSVTIVADGFALESEATRLVPDVVLLDVRMPGRCGLETLRAIRRKGLLEDVPVIAVTGTRDPAIVPRAKASGARRLLYKPLIASEIVSVIASETDRQAHTQ